MLGYRLAYAASVVRSNVHVEHDHSEIYNVMSWSMMNPTYNDEKKSSNSAF
jgi:hypothetical protein